MATTKTKADNYIRQVTAASNKAKAELSIDTADIDLIIRVNIQSYVSYNEHEDED